MRNRKNIFVLIVVSVALTLLLAAGVSILTFKNFFASPLVTVCWIFLTLASQLPFIIIPADRGRTLQYIFHRAPQWILHVILTVNLANVSILVLSPLLALLPKPSFIFGVLPVAVVVAMFVIVHRSAYTVVERRFSLPVEGLTESWKGVTVLHLSDLHAGPFLRPERLEKLVERINERGGFDICVMTGDVVNHDPEDLAWALPILEKIQAPMGTFASIGNHEYIGDERRVKELYSQSRIQLLLEDSTVISDGRHNVRLIGVDYPFHEGSADKTGINRALQKSLHFFQEMPGEMRILLSHHPEGFRGAREMNIPLTLAGHTHGGQVIVRGKNIVSRFVRYKRGIYKKGECFLFVNSGMGNWLPFRIGCPCEYALLSVIRKPAAEPYRSPGPLV